MDLFKKKKKKRVEFESMGAGDDDLPEIEQLQLEAPSPPVPGRTARQAKPKKVPRRSVKAIVEGKKPAESFPKYPEEEKYETEPSELYEGEEEDEDEYDNLDEGDDTEDDGYELKEERKRGPSFEREFRGIARKVVIGGYLEDALVILQDEKALFDFYTLQKRARLYGSKKV